MFYTCFNKSERRDSVHAARKEHQHHALFHRYGQTFLARFEFKIEPINLFIKTMLTLCLRKTKQTKFPKQHTRWALKLWRGRHNTRL